ncbi:unnamed protein product, partial [Closterium sp. Yama58-4]
MAKHTCRYALGMLLAALLVDRRFHAPNKRPAAFAHPQAPCRVRPSASALPRSPIRKRPAAFAHPQAPCRVRPSASALPRSPIRKRPAAFSHSQAPCCIHASSTSHAPLSISPDRDTPFILPSARTAPRSPIRKHPAAFSQAYALCRLLLYCLAPPSPSPSPPVLAPRPLPTLVPSSLAGKSHPPSHPFLPCATVPSSFSSLPPVGRSSDRRARTGGVMELCGVAEVAPSASAEVAPSASAEVAPSASAEASAEGSSVEEGEVEVVDLEEDEKGGKEKTEEVEGGVEEGEVGEGEEEEGEEEKFELKEGKEKEKTQGEWVAECEENYKEVVFPKNGKDSVAVRWKDVEQLKPGRFLNDTLIDFYLKHLEVQAMEQGRIAFPLAAGDQSLPAPLPPAATATVSEAAEEGAGGARQAPPSVHFFNCFFFKRLIGEEKAAHSRVRTWTRGVNLFACDFVFIPVNLSLHWSLLVICHPNRVVSVPPPAPPSLQAAAAPPLRDPAPTRSSHHPAHEAAPCILHFDSLPGLHGDVEEAVRSYLQQEYLVRHNVSPTPVITNAFNNLPVFRPKVPRQPNTSDCGVFLLLYAQELLSCMPLTVCRAPACHQCKEVLSFPWLTPDSAKPMRAAIRRTVLLRSGLEKLVTREPMAEAYAEMEERQGNARMTHVLRLLAQVEQ